MQQFVTTGEWNYLYNTIAKKRRGEEVKDKPSLYRFFRRIAPYVSDERDRGLLIGLSVFDSAYRFETEKKPLLQPSGNRLVDEVRVVYVTLGDAITQLELHRDDPDAIYTILSTQEARFDSEVRDGQVRQKYDRGVAHTKSGLLEYLVPMLFSSGTAKDRLKRAGIDAYEGVLRTGSLDMFKSHEIAERDFRQIIGAFNGRRPR